MPSFILLTLLELLLLVHSALIPPLGRIQGIFPVSNLALSVRHCDYVGSACPFDASNQDFQFNLVNGLDNSAGSYSFQSINYPTYYLGLYDSSTGTVGVINTQTSGVLVSDLSWNFNAPGDNTYANISWTLGIRSTGTWSGYILSVTNTNQAPCGYSAPSGDLKLVRSGSVSASTTTWVVGNQPPAPPAPTVAYVVSADTIVNPAVSKRFMGCHSDPGFAQTPRGFSANLIYGSSFEDGTMKVPAWTTTSTSGSTPSFGLDTYAAWSTRPSKYINLGAGTNQRAGLVNRGIGGGGFYFVANQPYDFEVWLYTGASGVVAYVELRDFTKDTVLATRNWTVTSTGPSWGSTWQKYTFELTPTSGTTCVGIPYGSDATIDCGADASPAHICVRCGGELVIGLATSNAHLNLGFISLMPGTWGRLKGPNGYLPVLLSGANLLTQMGITVMRSGGSVSQSARWKDWRGAVWNRPSQQQMWGNSLLSGWGPFDFIEMCEALNIEPIVTLAYDLNSAQDWSDLVEYCWGDPDTTTWGKIRASDGHPTVYNITVFELGNEQYNPSYVDQVTAMEATAKKLNTPPLKYMFPATLNSADAQKIVNAGLPVERIMPDLHVGASGAVEAAANLFNNPPIPGFDQSAINCETNAGTHDMERALNEAADLIDWFTYDTSVTNRLYARTASFCTGTSSQFDTWDQGISFFLPNMTWLQPPGWVHVMVTQTWGDITILSKVQSGTAIPFAAQLTKDKSKLFIRAVNKASGIQPLNITINGLTLSGSTYHLTKLSATGNSVDNTPSAPLSISPINSDINFSGSTISYDLDPYTFAIFSFTLN